ncbi:MAG: hypothetical protein DME24_01165 [Verrucomicrobia bacterium]|nr:MAG: hypothetical protein DME24_01165 [Verrucomicrobiota bacterium]
MNLQPRNPSAWDCREAAPAPRIGRCKRTGASAGNQFAVPFQASRRRFQDLPVGGGMAESRANRRLFLPLSQPTRMDLAVHLILGLAALVAVIFALRATFEFCAQIDRIAATLNTGRSSAIIATPGY